MMNKLNQKIPEGWSFKKLKDVAQVITGSTPSTADNTNYGNEFLFVSPADIKNDIKCVTNTITRLSCKGFKSCRIIKKGSPLFVCIGSTIGKVAIAGEDLATNQQINSCVVKSGFDSNYLYYKLLSSANKIKLLAGEQAVPIINKSTFEKIYFTFPPLAEQEKIAGILGTWDEAIEKLSSLIEQKKLLKKGLMQKLLTGKTRLNGFPQPWKDYELSDLLDYEQPTKYLVNDILKYSKEKVPVLTANKAFILGSTDDTCGIYCKGNCIIFDDFTTDMKYVTFPFKVKSSAIKILTSKENVILKFVFEQMKRINYPLGGHKRYYLSEYQYITIQVPDIIEQQAIADVLSTADEEINLLNKKLEALKEQKKGLMQQLLTGQIRVKVN